MLDVPVERLLKIPSGMSDDDHRAASERIERDSLDGLEVSCFGGAFGPIWDAGFEYDLEFLKHYRSVRSLRLGIPLSSLDGLDAISDSLTKLATGTTDLNGRDLSLAPFARLRALRALDINGESRDLETVSSLQSLSSLALRRGSQARVPVVAELSALEHLHLGFGSLEDTSPLENLQSLKTLRACWIRKEFDPSCVRALPELRLLELESLARIESLPDMSANRHLHSIVCTTLNGLRDLDGLSGSTVCELAIINSKVPPEAFERIADRLDHLESLVVHLKRKRDIAAAVAHFDADRVADSTNAFTRFHRYSLRIEYVPFTGLGD